MPESSNAIAPPQTQFSSGLTPGKLPGVDGRSWAARRYRELVAQMSADLGGDLTAASTAVICRAATLITWAEQAEAGFARTGKIDVQQYTTAINALRRLLADIGLDRKARDVTPDLNDWIAAREEAA